MIGIKGGGTYVAMGFKLTGLRFDPKIGGLQHTEAATPSLFWRDSTSPYLCD
jgi:hypothetical protein